LAREGPISFYDDSFTLHHANYQRDTRNILLKCVNIKGNQVTYMWGSKINIKNANPSYVMEIHRETSEALSHTMDGQGKENARLKQRINELEVVLIPRPLFSNPLSIVHPTKDSLGQSHKFDKITYLLAGVYAFVTYNIK
jgi:hypothetical protein